MALRRAHRYAGVDRSNSEGHGRSALLPQVNGVSHLRSAKSRASRCRAPFHVLRPLQATRRGVTQPPR